MDVSNNEYKSKANEKIFSRLTNPFLIYDDINNDNTTLNLFVKRSLNLVRMRETITCQKEVKHIIESSENDIVYVQFSSGTTGEPRGAILRKKNISCNCEDIIRRLNLTSEDKFLSWQPLTHCYGLIVFHSDFLGS